MPNKTKINEVLEAQNWGMKNTCSEKMLEFLSRKILNEPLKFDFENANNDYQIGLGDIPTLLNSKVPRIGSTLDNQPDLVQSRTFDDVTKFCDELKDFLNIESAYFVRTGTNAGGGHWSALYYDKDNHEWLLRSSEDKLPQAIIKNGEFGSAASFFHLSNSEAQSSPWGKKRSLFMIEANKHSIYAAADYVRAFRGKVLQKNASNAGTEAVNDYAKKIGVFVEPASNDVPGSEAGLEAEDLIIRASQQIQASSECQKYISEFEKQPLELASSDTRKSLISINLDPILFLANSHQQEKLLTDDDFINRLNSLDKNKSYFVRCGKLVYPYEKEKPSLELFYYNHDQKGWFASRDNQLGRSILTKEGKIDDTIKGNYVNDNESYWERYHCAFLEITPEVLDKAVKYIHNFRMKTNGLDSLSDREKSNEFKQKVKRYEGDKRSKENKEEKLQEILNKASSTDRQLFDKDVSLIKNISPVDTDKQKLEELLKERRDSISEQARKEAEESYSDECAKEAINKAKSECRDDFYQALKPIYTNLIQEANAPVDSLVSDVDESKHGTKKLLNDEQLAWKCALEEAEERISKRNIISDTDSVKKVALSAFKNSAFFKGSPLPLTEEETKGKSYVHDAQKKEIDYWNEAKSRNSTLDPKGLTNCKGGG